MKKSELLVSALTFFWSTSFSQISKGNWLVGGNASFSYTTGRYGGAAAANEKTHYLLISPSIGYFLVNNFPIGLKAEITSTGNVNFSGTYYVFGPFTRYYFLKEGKIINLFVEGNYSYGFSKTRGVSGSDKSSSYSFFAGPELFFNSSSAIELTMGYYHGNQFDNNYLTNSFQVGIGFKLHLKK